MMGLLTISNSRSHNYMGIQLYVLQLLKTEYYRFTKKGGMLISSSKQ
jgi:hypothetical protein